MGGEFILNHKHDDAGDKPAKTFIRSSENVDDFVECDVHSSCDE